MPTWRIVNASPLILLNKIGRIDLLTAEGVDVVVPTPVLQEVSSLDPSDPVVRAIHDAGWSVVMPPAPVPASVSHGSSIRGRSPCSRWPCKTLDARW